MGAVSDFLEFFDELALPDATPVLVQSDENRHGAILLERMLAGSGWPLSRVRDLVGGREAIGLDDPNDESARDFHIGVEFALWFDGRSLAINGSGDRVLSLDVKEDEQEFLQAIADVVGHCRTLLPDTKGKAGDLDYRGRTAAKVVAAVRRWRDDAQQRTNSRRRIAGDSPNEWGIPLVLDEYTRAPFPVDALPPVLRNAVKTVADSVGATPDIAGAIALGCASFAAGRLARVELKEGHSEPTTLWLLPVAPAGGGKSPQQKVLMAPIRAWERAEREQLAVEIAAKQAEYDAIKAELDADQKKIAKLDAVKREAARPAYLERRAEFNLRTRPELPRYIVGDFTEAALSGMAARAGGVILVMDDEGASILQAVSGRHAGDGGTQASLFVKLWAGAHHDEARQTRDGHELSDRNVATVVCPIQPNVLRDTKNLRQLRDQGVLDRFAVHVADVSPVPADPPPPNREALAAYSETLSALLSLRPYEPNLGEPDGIPLSADARAVRRRFIDELNARVAGGDLEFVAGAVAKLRANVERLAGVLHLVSALSEQAYRVPISAETMASAVEVGRYWLANMLALQGMLETPPTVAAAQRALGWIERQAAGQGLEHGIFTKQACWQGVKGSRSRMETAADLDAALGLLVEHDFIRRKGTRPESFEVNPLWLSELDQ